MTIFDREKELRDKVLKADQRHIFRFWDELNESSKLKLLNQVASIDFNLLAKLKSDYLNGEKKDIISSKFEPPDIIPIPSTMEQIQHAEHAKKVGENLLRQRKVGAILVAGGQGTRLGFDGPKGIYKISPIANKSLFQLFAEQIAALNRRYDTIIPWFIMTSESNNNETIDFFKNNDYFNLNPKDIYFFTQGMLPAIDANGKVFLESEDHIFTNPNGHGGTIFALKENGCLDEMKKRGIEELFYFQIDNVLIKICDPYFMGYHALANADMSLKVLKKRDPQEKVGVVGKVNNKLTVIEYSDMPNKMKEALNNDGSLKYWGGSIAIHMFKREFLEFESVNANFPFHIAHKKIKYIDENGALTSPKKANGYKFEMFIFDALEDARNAVVMEVDRKNEFSPVKNMDGVDSPETARADLINYYRRMLFEAGVQTSLNGGLIEISPNYALDVEELKQRINTEKIKIATPLYLD